MRTVGMNAKKKEPDELEILKKENARLKKENAGLKKENAGLKKQREESGEQERQQASSVDPSDGQEK